MGNKNIDFENVDNFISLEAIEQVEEDYSGTIYGQLLPTPFVPIYYNANESKTAKNDIGNGVNIYYNITYSKSWIPYIIPISFNLWVEKRLENNEYEVPVSYIESEYFPQLAYIEFTKSEDEYVQMCLSNNNEF